MDDEGRVHDVPDNYPSWVADKALEAARAEAERLGTPILSILLLVHLDEVPDGESFGLGGMVGDGAEMPDPYELLNLTLNGAVALGEACGVDVHPIQAQRPIGHG